MFSMSCNEWDLKCNIDNNCFSRIFDVYTLFKFMLLYTRTLSIIKYVSVCIIAIQIETSENTRSVKLIIHIGVLEATKDSAVAFSI